MFIKKNMRNELAKNGGNTKRVMKNELVKSGGNVKRITENELAKSGGNVKRLTENKLAKSGGNVNITMENVILDVSPAVEFAKWLAYEPEREKKRKKYLFSKTPASLTIAELDELKKYREYKIYAHIFQKYAYDVKKCSEKEYIAACDYMEKHRIETLMLEKLTEEEIIYGNYKTKVLFSSMTEKECREYLNNGNTRMNLENYLNMSMIDSYIFHQISNMFHARSLKKLVK